MINASSMIDANGDLVEFYIQIIPPVPLPNKIASKLNTVVLSSLKKLGSISSQSKFWNYKLLCFDYSAIKVNHTLQKSIQQELPDIEANISICIRHANEATCAKKLAIFDMDSTLVAEETLDEIAQEAGIGEQIKKITTSAMLGEIDFNTSFKMRMELLANTDIGLADVVRQRLRLQPGAISLLEHLHKQGVITAIVSGGFDYFANHVGKILNIKHTLANSLLVANKKITGKVAEPIIDADAKLDFVKRLMATYNLTTNQVMAVGDGANDLAMLSFVGLGVAFCGKPVLKKHISCQINYTNLGQIISLLTKA